MHLLPTAARSAAPRAPGVLAGLVVLSLLAACGGDGSAAAPSPASDATAGASATVEVVHRFGTTAVEGRPERIVVLGLQWTDVLLSLGVQPVGHLSEPAAGPTGTYPWQSDLSADSQAIEAGSSLPLEQIAALDPDLILVTHLAAEEAVYDSLAAIAPTVGLLGDRQVDAWQDLAEVAGAVLGEQERAEAVVAEVEQLVAGTAAELPGLRGKTFSLANHVPGDSIYVVADPADGSSVFFQELGMVLDPEILEAAAGAAGRAQLSLEQAGMLDADLLVLFSNDGDPRDLVGYDQLPSVVAGSVAEVGFVPVVGLNTPTPLSIPFSLDVVRPALEVAAS